MAKMPDNMSKRGTADVGSMAGRAWDWLKKANVSPSKAAAKGKENARRSMMPKTAGYSGATGNVPKAPEKSAKMMAGVTAPSKKKAAAKPPMPVKSPTKKAKSGGDGFNFGAAIARGFGGETAWDREKKKAGVKD